MLPVGNHVPVSGSYSSPVASTLVPLFPPDTSTWPDFSRTAGAAYRAVLMLPVAVHVPDTCAPLVDTIKMISPSRQIRESFAIFMMLSSFAEIKMDEAWFMRAPSRSELRPSSAASIRIGNEAGGFHVSTNRADNL